MCHQIWLANVYGNIRGQLSSRGERTKTSFGLSKGYQDTKQEEKKEQLDYSGKKKKNHDALSQQEANKNNHHKRKTKK